MHTSWLYFYWILHTCMFVFTWICQCVYTLVCMHVEARGWHWQASLFALQFIFLRVLKYFYLCIYSFICFCVYVDAHICGKLCVWGQRTTCRNLFSFYYVGSRDQTQAWQQTPLPTELFCKPPPPPWVFEMGSFTDLHIPALAALAVWEPQTFSHLNLLTIGITSAHHAIPFIPSAWDWAQLITVLTGLSLSQEPTFQ